MASLPFIPPKSTLLIGVLAPGHGIHVRPQHRSPCPLWNIRDGLLLVPTRNSSESISDYFYLFLLAEITQEFHLPILGLWTH